MIPSISNTYDIEGAKRHAVDIEWAFDIEVFDIECYARYRRSDTRHRGGKDPDVLVGITFLV
jgi:hypothetical protein